MPDNKKSNIDKKEVMVTEPSATEDASDKKASSVADDNGAKKNQKKIDQNKINKGSAISKITLLIVLIVLIAGIVASVFFWQQHLKQKQFLEQQSQRLNNLQSQFAELGQDVSRTSQLGVKHTQQLSQLSEQVVLTQSISQQAIEIVNRSQREWALSEIDYLLRMAHRRIEVAKDVAGAIAALKGADERIKELADLNLFKIRKQLAKDIAGLNAIHQADVNGISLAIDGMLVYISELPFKSVKDEIKVQLSEDKKTEPVTEEDKSFVDSVFDTVKKIGDIKVHQRSIEAASSLEQQTQIEQLLRTYLLSSRLAALRFNQTQFLREIQQASEILRLHYDVTDNRVEQLQKTLSDLSALQLNPDLPELTKAWNLLQKEINKSEVEKEAESTAEKEVTLEAVK